DRASCSTLSARALMAYTTQQLGAVMDTPATEQTDDISLLDLLVVIAESWAFLSVVPILVGSYTFAVLQFQTQTFSSSAVLAMPQAELEAAVTEEFISASVGPQATGTSAADIMSGLTCRSEAPLQTVVSLEFPDQTRLQAVLASIVGELDRMVGREFLETQR